MDASATRSQHIDDQRLDRLYQELEIEKFQHRRGVLLQTFCADLWRRIQQTPPPPECLVDRLVHLLQNDDDLLLAQLVIPDLRPNAESEDASKAVLLNRINKDRPSIQMLKHGPQPQDLESQHRFQQEKEKLQEAELYRASILLYGHGNLDEAHKQKVRDWLAAYPVDGKSALSSPRRTSEA